MVKKSRAETWSQSELVSRRESWSSTPPSLSLQPSRRSRTTSLQMPGNRKLLSPSAAATPSEATNYDDEEDEIVLGELDLSALPSLCSFPYFPFLFLRLFCFTGTDEDEQDSVRGRPVSLDLETERSEELEEIDGAGAGTGGGEEGS